MQKATSRRAFLRMTVAGLGLIALRASELERFEAHAATVPDQLTNASEILKAIILEHTKAKDNPWLLMHGVRAMGKEFTIGDDSAVEYLCSHYLREKVVNGQPYLYMPIADEGHTNAFLSEAALDTGIERDYPFRRNNHQYTIDDLVVSAKALFTFEPSSFNPDDLAWSLVVFAYTTAPEQDNWINAYGMTIRFSDVVEFGMASLEKATTRFRAAMRQGILADGPDGIYKFTCGGTHLIYGLSTCLRFGYTRRALAERMKVQFDILVWRLESDWRLIERYYKQVAADYPQDVIRIYFLDAKLKFLGHALEVINHARLSRAFFPTPAQEEIISRAQMRLVNVVEALGREGVEKFVGDKKLFNLLLGDACHAYHGLTMISEV